MPGLPKGEGNDGMVNRSHRGIDRDPGVSLHGWQAVLLPRG
jgi:hypothetical protein